MDYDPKDHVFTTRQIVAGWIVCIGIVGLALGLTGSHADGSAAAAAEPLGHAASMTPMSAAQPAHLGTHGLPG